MKSTFEQNKQKTLNYLTRTANHAFIDDGGNYQLIKLVNDNTLLVLQGKIGSAKTYTIDIDRHCRMYEENSANVMSQRLFLNRGLKSIKGAKWLKKQFEVELTNMAGLTQF